MSKSSVPNILGSILGMKCPKCRKGNMFRSGNPWNLKKVFDMGERCEKCGQPFEIEVGFYYGTGYVSYALCVAFSVATAIAWFVLVGFGSYSMSFMHWLIVNIVLLVLIQPWLMRLSRSIYIHMFVSYDETAIKNHQHSPAASTNTATGNASTPQ